MSTPTRIEAQKLLEEHVKDSYQLYHAKMVAVAMDGYAKLLGQDADLWYVTGLLHDIDFEEFTDTHPKKSLEWFAEWGYPEEFIHAILAHTYGFNGNTTLPQNKLAAALIACDEISGIFYAFKKINPVPYGEMKASSIKKRLAEKAFAAKISRESIYIGCEALGVSVDDHVANLINFYKDLN